MRFIAGIVKMLFISVCLVLVGVAVVAIVNIVGAIIRGIGG